MEGSQQEIAGNSTSWFEQSIHTIFGDQDQEKTTLLYLSLGHLVPFAFMFQFTFLKFGGAPYGRYKAYFDAEIKKAGVSFGPSLNGQLAWFIQEIPAVVWPLVMIFFSEGRQLSNRANLICILLYLTHFAHRTFIYCMRKSGQPYEVFFSLMMSSYVSFQAFLTTRYLSQYGVLEQNEEYKPRFILGCVIFVIGFVINVHSDHLLVNLRKNGDTGYHIPRGGLFEYVSGANFFGETLEWFGFCVAAWNIPALSYFLMSCLNIVPRAFQHHRFYLQKFDDYPKTRKAFLPFLL